MTTFLKRYVIYLADLNPTVGGEIRKVRPVVVVSRNEMNQILDTVVVCPHYLQFASSLAGPATDTMRRAGR